MGAKTTKQLLTGESNVSGMCALLFEGCYLKFICALTSIKLLVT